MTIREFIEEISTLTGYEFTEKQNTRLVERCKPLPEKYLDKIYSIIERTPNIPKNVFGLVVGHISWAENELKNARRIEQWRTVKKENLATPEEISLTMKIIGILMRFEHSIELCARFSSGMDAAISKNCLLEFLKKAESFYETKIAEGVKMRNEVKI